jgi:hypothetical protein
MAGTRIHTLAKLRAQILLFASLPQNEYLHGKLLSRTLRLAKPAFSCRNETMRPGQTCGNLLLKFTLLTVAIRSTVIFYLWQSAF